MSRRFGIRRDLTVELFYLFNLPFFRKYDECPSLSKRLENKMNFKMEVLKKLSKGYFEHYQGKTTFDDLKSIACRIVVNAELLDCEENIWKEVEAMENIFERDYIKKEIKLILGKTEEVIGFNDKRTVI